MGMLNEAYYLNKRLDYTAWNEGAEESEEQVVSFVARDALDQAREEMAAWNHRPREETEEENEPQTLRQEEGDAAPDGERRSDRS